MIRHLIGHAALLAASGGHPVVRYDVPDDPTIPALAYAGAVAFARRSAIRGIVVTVLGAPDEVADLITSDTFGAFIFATEARARVSVPAASLADLETAFRVREGGDWEWMFTTTPPPEQRGEADLITLAAHAKDELDSFLQQHNPRTDGRPFARAGQLWLGVRDERGRLLACGCYELNEAGYGALVGITTDPIARGLGLGTAVTAGLTRRALDAGGVSLLGMYADNAPARAIYHRLGYVTAVEFASRLVFPRRTSPL